MSLFVLVNIFLLMLQNCGFISSSARYLDQEGNYVTDLIGLFHNLPFSVTRKTCGIEYEWKATFQMDGEVYSILHDYADNFWINGSYVCNAADMSDEAFEIVSDIIDLIEDYMIKE